jgi:MFS-type transporter involved in bile tolerance (Atg22 family)
MNNPIKHFGFQPENYKILLIGLAINVVGFLLMIGGGSEDPNKFDGEALFSTVRITIAPIFILVGYGVILFSIMKKPKHQESPEKDLIQKEKEPSSAVKQKK